MEKLKKIKDLNSGYAICVAKQVYKYSYNTYVYHYKETLQEAKYLQYSLERGDNISYVIVDLKNKKIIY